MKVIVGLGNPGKRYQQTPHNVGFDVIDKVACDISCELRRSFRFKARIGRGLFGGEEILLVKPETYMNLSGRAVAPILRYRKLTPADMILVADDADLDIGMLRIRVRGSSGGHNGVASVIQSVGSEDFVRVRIGVGRDQSGRGLVEHVLTAFSPNERKLVDEVVVRAGQSVFCVLESGVEEAMNRFNGSVIDKNIGT